MIRELPFSDRPSDALEIHMPFADFASKPNLLIIITDQQSGSPHWPPGWAEQNLPAMKLLKQHGLTFTRANIASSTCSPSRVSLFTGLYPAQHGVTEVLQFDDPDSETQRLQIGMMSQAQNLAKILKTAGYNVVFKGKWHLTKPATYVPQFGGLYWAEADTAHIASRWSFDGWNQPDAGDNMDLHNMGGGKINNDGRFVDGHGQAGRYGEEIPLEVRERQSAVHFLQTYDSDRPFCLIVSLVNPHDVLAYPGTGLGTPEYEEAGYSLADFEDLPIDPPATVDEDLSTKPAVQASYRTLCNLGNGFIRKRQEKRQRNYCRFYAYLTRLVDREILKVLKALKRSGKFDETIVVRLSDHGDMAMSHGRQRQKMYNVYQETLNVPLIFSNPRLYPRAEESDSMASLIDLLPTLATIAGVPDRERWTFKGKDLTPILEQPRVAVQDCVHFTYDDLYFYVAQPNRIRCIVEKNWKYAVYYNTQTGQAPQYEMYNLAENPQETVNLAYPGNYVPEVEPERARLHRKLTRVMQELGTTPNDILWPRVSDFDPEESYPDSASAEEESDVEGATIPMMS